LALWLDSLDTSTILDASGNPCTDGVAVATWKDKSGNGRHAAQSTVAKRPVKSGSGLLFDGVDDGMDIAYAPDYPTHPFEVWGVFERTAPSSNDMVLEGAGNVYWQWSGSSIFRLFHGLTLSLTMPTAPNLCLMHTISDGVNSYVRINDMAATGDAGTRATSTLRLGYAFAPYFFKGYWRELIAADYRLAPAINTRIDAYLRARWGITG
jgi:hypothetical protein